MEVEDSGIYWRSKDGGRGFWNIWRSKDGGRGFWNKLEVCPILNVSMGTKY